MKLLTTILLSLFVSLTSLSQNLEENRAAIKKACMNYIEGFYEGDTLKLKQSLKPRLYKFGYWKNSDEEGYKYSNQMTYTQALNYAKNVLEKKQFPKADAPKEVTVLDIGDVIAAAKVSAWWGIDYILLSKENDTWMIEQVIWEGPQKD